MNLLRETVEDIEASGHAPEDIVFIGSEKTGHRCSWDEFRALADVEYDSGFGAAQVAEDLIIVFSDGTRMWRGEYDGREWWEYSWPFAQPEAVHPIEHLVCFGDKVGWETLEELNGGTAT